MEVQGQQPSCALVTASSPLEARLRCTFANLGRGTLSDALLPIAEDVAVSGRVQADPTLNLYPFQDDPPRTIACADSDHLSVAQLDDRSCVGWNNDGDLTFYIVLDDASASRVDQRLRPYPKIRDWWLKHHNLLHVEVLMAGRNIVPPGVRLFPGWQLNEGFLFDGAEVRYDGFLDCKRWHFAANGRHYCESLWIAHGGQTLRAGSMVEVRGALVIDCNDKGVAAGCPSPSELEIHPAYSFVMRR
jgi:hypothetical protein